MRWKLIKSFIFKFLLVLTIINRLIKETRFFKKECVKMKNKIKNSKDKKNKNKMINEE